MILSNPNSMLLQTWCFFVNASIYRLIVTYYYHVYLRLGNTTRSTPHTATLEVSAAISSFVTLNHKPTLPEYPKTGLYRSKSHTRTIAVLSLDRVRCKRPFRVYIAIVCFVVNNHFDLLGRQIVRTMIINALQLTRSIFVAFSIHRCRSFG